MKDEVVGGRLIADSFLLALASSFFLAIYCVKEFCPQCTILLFFVNVVGWGHNKQTSKLCPRHQRDQYKKPAWTKKEFNDWKQFVKSQKEFNTMTNIWESPEVLEALGNASDSGSTFLNKALGDGDSIKLKYTALLRQEQPDDTDERYRSPDGKIWRLEFEDTEGKERVMEQKTLKSRLISAMRSADVQIGQWIEITRTGLNTETEYEVVLLAANGEPQVAPTSTEDRPF